MNSSYVTGFHFIIFLIGESLLIKATIFNLNYVSINKSWKLNVYYTTF